MTAEVINFSDGDGTLVEESLKKKRPLYRAEIKLGSDSRPRETITRARDEAKTMGEGLQGP